MSLFDRTFEMHTDCFPERMEIKGHIRELDVPVSKITVSEYILKNQGAGIAQSVQRLATGWTVRGSNPGGGEIFLIRPDRP